MANGTRVGRPPRPVAPGMKWCPGCQQERARGEFGRHAARPDGLTAHCRSCKRARERAADPDRTRQRTYSAKYRTAHRDRVRAADREAKRRQRERDTDAVRHRRKRWEAANREALRRGWKKHGGIRRARQRGTRVQPITAEALEQRLSMFGHRCWLYGGPEEAIDHVKPLAKGGAHVLANLRPICRPCNSRKRDRWPL